MAEIKKKKEESFLFKVGSDQKTKKINNATNLDLSNMISVENMIALKEKSARIAKGITNSKLPTDITFTEEKSNHNIDINKGIINETVNSKIDVKTTTDEVVKQKINKVNTSKANFTEVRNISISKKSLIEQIETAKTDHLNYMKNIHVFLQLNDNTTNPELVNPHNYTMCAFGKWYYSKGQFLTELSEFNKVETLHITVHNYYLKIYKLYSITLKKSLFKTLEKLEKERLIKVEKLVVILESNSNQLIDLLDKTIIKINNMSSKELKSIIS